MGTVEKNLLLLLFTLRVHHIFSFLISNVLLYCLFLSCCLLPRLFTPQRDLYAPLGRGSDTQEKERTPPGTHTRCSDIRSPSHMLRSLNISFCSRFPNKFFFKFLLDLSELKTYTRCSYTSATEEKRRRNSFLLLCFNRRLKNREKCCACT